MYDKANENDIKNTIDKDNYNFNKNHLKNQRDDVGEHESGIDKEIEQEEELERGR
jgi:hypothetical protein